MKRFTIWNRVVSRRFLHSQNVITELKQRGLISQISSPGDKILQSSSPMNKFKLYCGVDPTAKSIHLGNLVPMMVLLHFYLRGHDIVNVIGGATGQVGDPSGRTEARKDSIIAKERQANLDNIGSQLTKFFQNGKLHWYRKYGEDMLPSGNHSVKNNIDWWKDVGMIEFLSKYGKHIRIQQMLSRDSISSRLNFISENKGKNDGLGFNEFTYQILQAFDFYHLYSKEGVTIQVGGNDQWGNIVAGIDLIQRLNNVEKKKSIPIGITVPLLTTANGTKFGKSAGNAIFLDPSMNTPFDLYQFFYNTLDEDVDKFLKIFTLLSLEEIESVSQKHNANPQLHYGQTVLAHEMTEMIHGQKETERAEFVSRLLFQGKIDENDNDVTKLIDNFSHSGILQKGQKSWDLIEVLIHVAKFSRKESRRKLEQGSVSIGIQRGNTIKQNIDPNQWDSYLIDGRLLILRIGKQKVYPVQLE